MFWTQKLKSRLQQMFSMLRKQRGKKRFPLSRFKQLRRRALAWLDRADTDVQYKIERALRRPTRRSVLLGMENLEGRQLMATFAETGLDSTLGLTIALDASQTLSIQATDNTETFTLSGLETNAWTGITSSYVTVSGDTLTITTDGVSALKTVSISDDSGANSGVNVSFGNSTSTYPNSFVVSLDSTSAGTVTFNNTTSFSGSSNFSVITTHGITFNSGATLTTVDGNLTLSANAQGTPASGSFVGINVNNATVQSTGLGAVSITGRGGDSNAAYGVEVQAGGSIRATGTGTVSVTGTGGATSTYAGGTNGFGLGVYVTGSSSIITSASGNVTVTGTGGGSDWIDYNEGVRVEDSATIASGGAGTLTVTGTGGGSATSTGGNYGVHVLNATITSGGGNVSITGSGTSLNSSPTTSSDGVYIESSGTSTSTVTSGTGGAVTIVGTVPGGGELVSFYRVYPLQHQPSHRAVVTSVSRELVMVRVAFPRVFM